MTSYLVPRLCREEIKKGEYQETIKDRRLDYYRDVRVYVLLGDPGMGKTSAFKEEAKATDGHYVTARDFITFDTREEWRNKVLFIDALDEVRAGTEDARRPFDEVRRKLDQLGKPKFRLSCRAADWLGTSDEEALKSVAADGKVKGLHLQPLTDDDIREVLEQNHRESISDPNVFMLEAEQRGLTELTRNPEILDMLVRAVSGEGEWPTNRLETFQLACKKLLQEHNQEHQAAHIGQPPDPKETRLAAGFLCSLILITGKAGFSLSNAESSEQYPNLMELDYCCPELLRKAVASKIFTVESNHVTYVHRIIAEFMASDYLCHQIHEKGLPINRVLALITSMDGVAERGLRGLFAWLAVLCHSERSSLIGRDALGVVLYGDVESFNIEDKKRILVSLVKEAERYKFFRGQDGCWEDYPFGALATPGMEPEFERILASQKRGDAHQALVDIALDALLNGKINSQALILSVEKIVRDDSWWPRVRYSALDVLLRLVSEENHVRGTVQNLVSDINHGSLIDDDDELLGRILLRYYPEFISPDQVIESLHARKQPNVFGQYVQFWNSVWVDKASDDNVRKLLNLLVQNDSRFTSLLENQYDSSSSVFKLLARGLESFGARIDISTLASWLKLGLKGGGYFEHEGQEYVKQCTEWLEKHSERQKSVIEFEFKNCLEKQNFNLCANRVRELLFSAKFPEDYGPWCLRKAESEANTTIAEYFFTEAVRTLYVSHPAPPELDWNLETLQEFVERRPEFQPFLKEMLYYKLPEGYLKNKQLYIEEKEEKKGVLEEARKHIELIRSGRAGHGFMYELASVYSRKVKGSADSWPQLVNHFGGDESLAEAGLEGLGNFFRINNLPEFQDIYQSAAESRMYFASLPLQVSLELLYAKNFEEFARLPSEKLKKALIFHFDFHRDAGSTWVKNLLETKKQFVSDALVEYAGYMIRAGKDHVSGIYLLREKEWSGVAESAVLPLLESFPARATTNQQRDLNLLLGVALNIIAPGEMLPLIEKKLSRKSMNIAQKVSWLVSAYLIFPEQFREPLLSFVISQSRRIAHLATFLNSMGQSIQGNEEAVSIAKQLNAPRDLALFIEVLGKSYFPYERKSGINPVTDGKRASDLVHELIQYMATIPTEECSQVLAKLLDNHNLEKWHEPLQEASYHQLVNKREALFQYPDIPALVQTLLNKKPANVADLAALVFDHIQDLAGKIEDGNTDDYRQYWNEDVRGRLKNRKHEDACRDAFLSDLQSRLAPLDVDAQPEGHYARDKRADIRVSFGGGNGFNIPIEIKCNDNREVWDAIHNQLIPRYTRDTGAHGFGIYLVFWFGEQETPPPPEEVQVRPRTSREMQDRIYDLLSEQEKRLISIRVINCSGE